MNSIFLKSQKFIYQERVTYLLKVINFLSTYKPISPYATIKLDLTVKIANFEDFKKTAFSKSKHLTNFELIDKFKDKITVRFYFSSQTKNLTEKEAQEELEKIKKAI